MTIRKRGDSWYVDISEKGKPRVQKVIKHARTRAQALRAEAVIRAQMFEKRYGLTEKLECRFDKFVEETFKPHKKLKKSYRSIESICKALSDFFGKYLLSGIDSEMIEKYKQARISGKTNRGGYRSPLRVNKELQVLSSIFTLALEKKLVDARPKITPFDADGKRVRYLTADEEKRLVAALEGQPWLKNIVTMALHTGMRRGEIFGLQWFDVDLNKGVLNVRQTKSGKDRLVPVNSVVRELLESLPKSSGYVFPSPHTKGRLVDVKVSFNAARAAAKVPDFRFHDLRHTAASRMAEAGADAFTLAAIFGWSDIRMALRYAHAMDEAKRRAVENLAEKQSPREKRVTKEKRQTGGSAVSS